MMMDRRRSGEGVRSRQGLGWAACCLGFLLKLLAFLQAFAAVSALLYAAWILSRWARHHQLHLQDLLPGLWFPSLVMAAGLFYCLLLLAGYLAAEINNGCCLCFYTIPAMAMMLLEAALAGHLTVNEHWIQDLPDDRTGELHNLLSFIHNNLDLCKWAALAIFATQALSLFLAMILRAMLSARTTGYDSDEDFVVIRRPLLLAQAPPPYLPTTVDTRGFRPDLWSSRMRQKYGLNTSDYTYNPLDANAARPQ
ncbi:tetraspanin-18-like [Panicum miliaceum]|uniref:Tetraspanin-18-like n=1 Tax=Panicum miliaceum TaxID=4540 RepID=A0A3L6RYC8_PANMI|nr:tetraspanin-18-like [Panicum miliaceum]